MRRILICGDRKWLNYLRVLACVQKANKTRKIDVIIEGDCRGADTMAGHAAKAIGLTVENGGLKVFPALWDQHGKAAGPIRNQQMLDEGKPTEVWAFHNDIKNSRGTADMVARARKAGLEVWILTETAHTHFPRVERQSRGLSRAAMKRKGIRAGHAGSYDEEVNGL